MEIPVSDKPNKNKGFAFIKFEKFSEGELAAQYMHGGFIDGKEVYSELSNIDLDNLIEQNQKLL